DLGYREQIEDSLSSVELKQENRDRTHYASSAHRLGRLRVLQRGNPIAKEFSPLPSEREGLQDRCGWPKSPVEKLHDAALFPEGLGFHRASSPSPIFHFLAAGKALSLLYPILEGGWSG